MPTIKSWQQVAKFEHVMAKYLSVMRCKTERKWVALKSRSLNQVSGRFLRTQWLAILLSLAIHGFTVAGLSRHCAPKLVPNIWHRIDNESRLKHEIQVLTQTLEQEKQNTAVAIAQAQQLNQNQCET